MEKLHHQPPLNPLQDSELNAFPLPKNLELLPNSNIKEFVENKELIQGYIKQLEAYKHHQSKLLKKLSTVDELLSKDITQLIEQYQQLIVKITQQIQSISTIYQEFVNLETIQYQLLSSNFNSENLKHKFAKLTEDESKFDFGDSKENGEFSDFIERFRANRRVYHYRKEKLNRWNEERVGGFL
ncbi:uncharacterized protein SPAPADRAFT_62174 [Spathaspora passalidarum NRRL Y-27907]|uniref:VPS37 C-terminal domain-containing protein n=1 Tax=Spathaspora passalidarum (strain NRRL Y-27907 / 11-Y1) TaxID=619300 RepID=G3AQL8_SPAPN|nr:uncharacterized protein SPAPADRAFT_62174 [Spathaspora passalidarum NRRL Y-27907]EGW31565.1 hypothetical protein SPAPADRAFT_62174 [Spathaspora passalidarum NRRL Y-27907]